MSTDRSTDWRSTLFAEFDRLGIATRTVEHPAVFTVAESEAIERDMPGGHTKNLFLVDAKGRLFLVVAEAHTPVALKTLHKTIGSARLSFGKADLLANTLGVTPGSVTAFAALADRDKQVQVVFDRRLLAFDTINCHPMANTATTAIGRDDLMRFLESTGHPPLVADLTAPAATTERSAN